MAGERYILKVHITCCQWQFMITIAAKRIKINLWDTSCESDFFGDFLIIDYYIL